MTNFHEQYENHIAALCEVYEHRLAELKADKQELREEVRELEKIKDVKFRYQTVLMLIESSIKTSLQLALKDEQTIENAEKGTEYRKGWIMGQKEVSEFLANNLASYMREYGIGGDSE